MILKTFSTLNRTIIKLSGTSLNTARINERNNGARQTIPSVKSTRCSDYRHDRTNINSSRHRRSLPNTRRIFNLRHYRLKMFSGIASRNHPYPRISHSDTIHQQKTSPSPPQPPFQTKRNGASSHTYLQC